MAKVYDFADLESLARSAGLSATDAKVAAAVALAESGGQPGAISSTGDYGLWQINARSWPQFSTSRLLDPSYNAKAMATVHGSTRGWNHWTTYRTGAYRKYLSTGSTINGESAGGGLPGVDDLIDGAGNLISGGADALNPLDDVGDWVGQLSENLGKVLLGLVLGAAGLAVAWFGITRLAADSPTGQQITGAVGTAGAVAAIL